MYFCLLFLLKCQGTEPSESLLLAVRRVKIGLVPSSGCGLSPLPSMKALSSAWGPITKVRLPPRVPANGSFSARSLALAQASTKYMKQISGLISGVTNIRGGSLSYEFVQGK